MFESHFYRPISQPCHHHNHTEHHDRFRSVWNSSLILLSLLFCLSGRPLSSQY